LWQTLDAAGQQSAQKHEFESIGQSFSWPRLRRLILLFLRLPRPTRSTDSRNARVLTWREEWLRQAKGFWSELAKDRNGKLDSYVETKEQYLSMIEDLMHTAAHLPLWAIEAVSDGFVSTDELVECVGNARKIDAIYKKDFSELLGIQASNYYRRRVAQVATCGVLRPAILSATRAKTVSA